MTTLTDLIIDIQADAESVFSSCYSFDSFCKKMIRINDDYLPSLLFDVWEGHIASQEPNNVNFHDRRPS